MTPSLEQQPSPQCEIDVFIIEKQPIAQNNRAMIKVLLYFYLLFVAGITVGAEIQPNNNSLLQQDVCYDQDLYEKFFDIDDSDDTAVHQMVSSCYQPALTNIHSILIPSCSHRDFFFHPIRAPPFC